MKPERRHELKTNELAEWLAQVPQWWNENYKMVVYISVVAVAVAAAAYLSWYRKNIELQRGRLNISRLAVDVGLARIEAFQQSRKGEDRSALFLATANKLDAAARATDDEKAAALALIKRGDALRAELHYRLVSLEPQGAQAQINQAKQSYEKALAKAGNNATLAGLAKFGLGLCEEELENLPAAEKIYREIVDNPAYQATIVPPQAEERLETMAEYKGKVHFTVKPLVELQQPTQPVLPAPVLQPQTPLPAVNVPAQVRAEPNRPTR